MLLYLESLLYTPVAHPLHLYSAQLLIIQIYTPFRFSRTEQNTTTKSIRRFVFVLECRRRSRRANNQHSFASSQCTVQLNQPYRNSLSSPKRHVKILF